MGFIILKSTWSISILEDGKVEFVINGKISGRLTYTYVINDGVEQSTKNKAGEITLNKGDKIKVKITFGKYEDSDWSSEYYYQP